MTIHKRLVFLAKEVDYLHKDGKKNKEVSKLRNLLPNVSVEN
jgi:hypothetical protein